MTNPVLVEVTRGAPRREPPSRRHRRRRCRRQAPRRDRRCRGGASSRARPSRRCRRCRWSRAAPPIATASATPNWRSPVRRTVREPRHVATALKMLAAAGRGEADLECGGHAPTQQRRRPTRWSAPAKRRRASTTTARASTPASSASPATSASTRKATSRPDHPAQREVTAALAAITGRRASASRRVDGCSIPAYAIPLDKLALAFARLGTGEGLPPARAAAARSGSSTPARPSRSWSPAPAVSTPRR